MVRNPENAQRHIIAFHMWSVVNFSEIVFHLYEVMNMHVYLKRVCHHRRFLWEDAVLHTEGGGGREVSVKFLLVYCGTTE